MTQQEETPSAMQDKLDAIDATIKTVGGFIFVELLAIFVVLCSLA